MCNFIKAIGLILRKRTYKFCGCHFRNVFLTVEISMDARWCFFVLNNRFASGFYVRENIMTFA